MSICPKMTEQDLINLGRLAEQQKNQRAMKIKKKLKQTNRKKLAESFTPITKKLDEVDKSTKSGEKYLNKLILKLKIEKR